MKLNLIPAIFIKRYKRFFADVTLNGETVTAHTPNTGSMKSCIEKDDPCWISPAENPERKLKYTLEVMNRDGAHIMVNTSLTNKLVHEALINKKIKELAHFDQIKAEAKIGDSRLDFYLTNIKGEEFYLEVKNVTLKQNNRAEFPDAVTERGQKHLLELMKLQKKKINSGILFVISRDDCKKFAAASDIDPEYAKLLKKAYDQNVLILAYQIKFQLPEMTLEKAIEVII
jgi:sugar fermentation stimulation protein A